MTELSSTAQDQTSRQSGRCGMGEVTTMTSTYSIYHSSSDAVRVRDFFNRHLKQSKSTVK